MEFRMTATNSRQSKFISDVEISSNLAYDEVQCLIALGNVKGSLEIFNLKGNRWASIDCISDNPLQ